MTLPLNSRLSALYDTNGTQKDFSFGFRVFFDPDNGGYGLEVRRQTADGYEIIPKSDYLVLPVEDNSAGVVRFSVAPSAGQQIYIAGKTPTIQQLVLTNFGRYSAESIETQFDFITAIIQEWISALGEETRQRIENDHLLKQHIEQRINDFIAVVDSRFEGKWLEISEYLDTLLPMFFSTMREEIEAFTNEQLPAIIDQRLSEVIDAEMDAYLDDLSHQVSQNIEAINEAAANATAAESAKNEAIVAKNQIVSEVGETKNYLDEALSQLSTAASKYYSTLAEANQNIASMAVNQLVYVGGTENSNNMGLWYKFTPSSTNLTKSAYDPLTQAKADATTKANAAEANAKSYTDNATEPKLLSGLDIYYQAKDNPTRLFQAIWQEYNKPVWYIGNATFVDTTGAKLKLYEQELLFTIKLTEANQTFIYPTRPTGTQTINATIDWGDGIVTSHTNYSISHTYIGSIGDEFQIKLKGVMPEFDFGSGNAGRRTSRLMLKSVDKNTMPKVMTVFDLAGCKNLVYLCRGAYSSWNNGATFSPRYSENSPDITFHPKAFEGLESVTNISGIFGRVGYSINFNIPAGLLDVFANATIASYAFYGLAKPLPVGILDKLINLEDVSYMFNIASITSIDNRIFKNQTKLKNVSNCFRQASSLVANAHQLYTDMNQGLPTIVNGCFLTASAMTNLASVPAGWKA